MDEKADTNGSIKTSEPAWLTETTSASTLKLEAGGDWVSDSVAKVNDQLRLIEKNISTQTDIVLDLKSVGTIDTAGSWLIIRLNDFCRKSEASLKITNASDRAQILLRAIKVPNHDEDNDKQKDNGVIRLLYSVGRFVMAVKRDLAMSLNIIGSAIQGSQLKETKSERSRLVPIVHHIDKMGFRAIPIIVLMSLLLGAIVSQQAAFQLRVFGFEAWASEFTAASLLREIAVLLTAIMVAGRSGSSMTAELGSMKMREEVDALNVIGLNPVGVLIFPRLVALTICLPLLAFISSMAALLGAALVLRFYSDVPFEIYLARIRAYIDLETVFSGLIKAPFMGFAIGLMSAVEGMKVQGSAESLGRRTTAAVVKSIFLVILIDGFFSVFYAAIDY